MTAEQALSAADSIAAALGRPGPAPAGHPQSLSRGATGVALLHIERAAAGRASWETAHAWLTTAARGDLIGNTNATLYFGTPALAFAFHTAADRPGKYQRVLAALDASVATIIRRRLDQAHARIDRAVRPALAEFDLINGLTGLGAYLLRRDPRGDLLHQVLAYLTRLTQPLPGQDLPGWWTSQAPAGRRPAGQGGGHGNLGLAHGIAGPLALLSLATRRGICIDGQLEAIAAVCTWLDIWQQKGHGATWWPETITLDEARSGNTAQAGPLRPSWCYKLTELNHEFSQFRGMLAMFLLASRLMVGGSDQRDLAGLVVLDVGRLAETGDEWEPYRLLDAYGAVVEPVAVFLAGLQAEDKSVSTLRAYGNDLLLWWRWLAAVGVAWNQATTIEGRDFLRWMRIADKPTRVHWRYRDGAPPPASAEKPGTVRRSASAGVNPVTGKAGPGLKYAPASRARAESTLRTFYDVHLETGQGPIVNPFPLDRSRRAGRASAHHNPMDQFKRERKGRYRPRVSKRIPKRIPDEQFNAIFAGLKYHRDRALLAFWVSTGARAEELLDSFQGDVYPGDQLISVTRKGSRDIQQIPASPDSFVWLRLYQEEIWKQGAPQGRDQPLWFTLRRPFRPLTYAAARAMFQRANELLGSDWGIHDLRHTAAWRMAKDPQMSITDVQWILAHASLETTQLYTTPGQHEVIASTLAYHQRRAGKPAQTPAPPAPGYNPESLRTLFGGLS